MKLHAQGIDPRHSACGLVWWIGDGDSRRARYSQKSDCRSCGRSIHAPWGGPVSELMKALAARSFMISGATDLERIADLKLLVTYLDDTPLGQACVAYAKALAKQHGIVIQIHEESERIMGNEEAKQHQWADSEKTASFKRMLDDPPFAELSRTGRNVTVEDKLGTTLTLDIALLAPYVEPPTLSTDADVND